jgi:hypothetical protein
VQGAGGFVAGVAIGMVPFGGLGERLASALGVLGAGTPAARVGLALGEIAGGLFLGNKLGVIGKGYRAYKVARAGGGIAAIVSISASAGAMSAVAANVGAGIHGLAQALTTGGGTSGPVEIEMHHTIPREIRAPRSGKPGMLPDHVANHPDVVGRPGLPNRWAVPKEVHREIHPRYNRRFEEEVNKIKANREINVKDVLNIRDRLVKEFGIDMYRP